MSKQMTHEEKDHEIEYLKLKQEDHIKYMEKLPMSPGEALYGFVCRLTALKKRIIVGNNVSDYRIMEEMQQFMKEQEIAQPREGVWPHSLKRTETDG